MEDLPAFSKYLPFTKKYRLSFSGKLMRFLMMKLNWYAHRSLGTRNLIVRRFLLLLVQVRQFAGVALLAHHRNSVWVAGSDPLALVLSLF